MTSRENSTLEQLPINPFDAFSYWYQAAQSTLTGDSCSTCFLATANSQGQPSLRTILLKDYSPKGFVFYTNYDSKKGQELQENPNAALLFYWPENYRQIRIEGSVEKTTTTESDEYFQSRVRGSQISASVSPQSKIIAHWDELVQSYEEFEKKHENQVIARPSNWGGFRLVAKQIEFWQGHNFRLHERVLFELKDGIWHRNWLAP